MLGAYKERYGSKAMNIRRGDIFYADLSPVIGSEQGGLRPVLIIQNDVGNRYSPTVIAAAITSRLSKTKLPTHIDVCHSGHTDMQSIGLAKDSVILLEQIRTLDKKRLKEKSFSLFAIIRYLRTRLLLQLLPQRALQSRR